jgi:tripartite ATP-independent transporter DctP family solute receptor
MKKGFLIAVMLLASVALFAQTTLTLGIVTVPGSAQHVAAEKFKELIEARSGGRYLIDIKHSASLGNESSIIQQIQLGTVDLGIITSGPVANIAPMVNVIELPFLFASNEQADMVLDGPLGQEILTSLEPAGIKGLAYSENGFRNLTNNVRPVTSASDLRGLKIRTMEAPMHVQLWRTLGANPTPMGWPINTELQQGTIDGQENPLWVIDTYKLYEVQDYMTMTRHVYSSHIDMMNLRRFNALSAADQRMFVQAMRDAATYQRQANRDGEAQFMANIVANGMQVNNNPDVRSFRSMVQPIYDNARRQIRGDFVDRVLAAVQ